MGGMTTVTLKDRRIDRQHSRAGQSAGIVASVGGGEDCIDVISLTHVIVISLTHVGWVEFFKDVGAGTP